MTLGHMATLVRLFPEAGLYFAVTFLVGMVVGAGALAWAAAAATRRDRVREAHLRLYQRGTPAITGRPTGFAP